MVCFVKYFVLAKESSPSIGTYVLLCKEIEGLVEPIFSL